MNLPVGVDTTTDDLWRMMFEECCLALSSSEIRGISMKVLRFPAVHAPTWACTCGCKGHKALRLGGLRTMRSSTQMRASRFLGWDRLVPWLQ